MPYPNDGKASLTTNLLEGSLSQRSLSSIVSTADLLRPDTQEKITMTNSLSSIVSSTSASPTAAQQKALVNYDNFLQLLIAQLKNQDPTDPVDAGQQLAQLASFSQVEQSIQTNQKLDALLAGSTLTQASEYIGKYIENADGSVKGTIASVKIYADGIVATTSTGGQIPIQPGIVLAAVPPSANGSASLTAG